MSHESWAEKGYWNHGLDLSRGGPPLQPLIRQAIAATDEPWLPPHRVAARASQWLAERGHRPRSANLCHLVDHWDVRAWREQCWC